MHLKTQKMIGLILIIVGALSLVIGTIVFNSSSTTKESANQADTPNLASDLSHSSENNFEVSSNSIISSASSKSSETKTITPSRTDSPSTIPAQEHSFDLEHIYEVALADGVLTAKEKDSIKDIASKSSLDYDKIMAELENKLKESGKKPETQMIDWDKKNGDDFEKYIAHKFDKKFFRIKEWTGDKYSKGIYGENSLNPDLLLEIKYPKTNFAVECKWKKKVYKGGVEFSNPEQLKRYQKYAKEKNTPVFIAIGLGGEASEPEQLFVVPLNELKEPFLYLVQLKRFEKRDLSKNFYFDPENLTLK